MKIKGLGCAIVVRTSSGLPVALHCSKGRGQILPGGKLEKNETYKQCAARELFEETGMVAKDLTAICSGLNTDLWYCHVYFATVEKIITGHRTREGITRLATWNELFESEFGGFYEWVHDHLINHCSGRFIRR